MRLLFASLILSISLSNIVVKNEPNPDQTKGTSEQKQTNPVEPPKALEVHISGTVKTETADTGQQGPEKKPAPFLTHGEWVMAILTLVYVVISAFGLRAIKHQASIAGRQADIADVAAKAAKLSADSLVNVERPWILVRMEPTGPHREGTQWFTGPKGQPPSKLLTSEETMRGEHHKPERIEFRIKNYGRSPGWVTSQWADTIIVDAISDLPSTPDYFIRPGPIHVVKCSDFLEPASPGKKNEFFLTPDALKSVASGNRFLYIYGIVNYRDAWKKEHHTRFCFFWFTPEDWDITPQQFYAEGPEGYNEET